MLAWREGLRPRPIYGAHKWFARRSGTVFRSILTAAALPPDSDFWGAYYDGVDWRGRQVLDPFVGGGTSVIEALRLGADVIGVDVDPVACAITSFETRAAEMPNLLPALDDLKREVGDRLAPYYRTTDPSGAPRDVLHYFWVQVVPCSGCGASIEAHPHHQLAYEAEGTRQWVFCPDCHDIQILDRSAASFTCRVCARVVPIRQGSVRFGRLTCPRCAIRDRLIDAAARTGRPPTWRLFAVEYLTPQGPPTRRALPLAQRAFQPASAADQAAFDAAAAELQGHASVDGSLPWVPDCLIPVEDRCDDRLLRYGYVQYRDLFNPRQLLHLATLAEVLSSLNGPEREALGLAFSDHLTTNCMLVAYTFGWRRISPLFAVRAFRHVARPVEVNPWLDGTGRGTFPNAVRQVQRAIEFARNPKEPLVEGGFSGTVSSLAGTPSAAPAPTARVLHGKAQSLDSIPDRSIDFVLTDPPYFDNVAYSELADFFLPWLRLLGLAPADDKGPVAYAENLAAKRRDEAGFTKFCRGLDQCFAEVARVLRSDGRLVFTFQHRTAGAWLALAEALGSAGLRPLQVFPLPGDARGSIHAHAGSSRWDAVFVMMRGARPVRNPLSLIPATRVAADEHCRCWVGHLRKLAQNPFREPDQANFHRACLVAAALGLFPAPTRAGRGVPLALALNATSRAGSSVEGLE